MSTEKYDPKEKFAGTTDTKTLKAAQEYLKQLKKDKKDVDSNK